MSIASILVDTDNPSAEPEIWADLNVQSVQAVDVITDTLVVAGGIDATQLQGVDISSTAPTNGQVLTYSSGSNEWYPAASGGGGGGGIPAYSSSSNQNLYISNVGGNDANDGLSAGNAVKTWSKLLEIGSTYNVDEIIIHLVQGETYTIADMLVDLDVPFKETRNGGTTTFTQILDFSRLNCSSVKVVTDMTGLQSNTPSSATPFSITTGGVSFRYYTHAAITTGTDRWTYDATTDAYNCTDFSQNTTTETYIPNVNAPLNVLEYYETTDMAFFDMGTGVIFNAPNMILNFERVNFGVNNTRLIGNAMNCRGCTFDGNIFLGGSQLNLVGNYYNSLTLIDGYVMSTNGFTDSSIVLYKANSSSVYDLFGDGGGFEVYNNSVAYFKNSEWSYFDMSNNSKLLVENCSSTDCFYTFNRNCDVTLISTILVNCNLGVDDNSRLICSNCTVGASFNVNESFVKLSAGTWNTRSGSSGLRINRGVFNAVSTTISDANGTLTTLFIEALKNSVVNLYPSTINTTTGRTGQYIKAIEGSKIILPATTISTASTANNLVEIDQGSELWLYGVLALNTSQNAIKIHGGSKLYSTSTPTNAGIGTVLQRGTTAAGPYAVDTAYNAAGPTTATNEMTLVLLI